MKLNSYYGRLINPTIPLSLLNHWVDMGIMLPSEILKYYLDETGTYMPKFIKNENTNS